jgi:hypothetical protein
VNSFAIILSFLLLLFATKLLIYYFYLWQHIVSIKHQFIVLFMLEFPRIAPLERVAMGMSIPEYKA